MLQIYCDEPYLVGHGQLLQGLGDGQQFVVRFRAGDSEVIEALPFPVTAVLQALAMAHAINQYPPHGLGSSREKVPAVIPAFDLFLVH
jgi:CTP-dependent riboflavin kinase